MPLINSLANLSPSPAPVLIRAACQSSSAATATATSPLQFVLFRHPGYPDSLDLMLRLSALDHASTPLNLDESGPTLLPEGVQARLGIHHATALQACIIIACNEPGFLSPTKLAILPAVPTPATELDLNSVLTAKSYWFYPLNWNSRTTPIQSVRTLRTGVFPPRISQMTGLRS